MKIVCIYVCMFIYFYSTTTLYYILYRNLLFASTNSARAKRFYMKRNFPSWSRFILFRSLTSNLNSTKRKIAERRCVIENRLLKNLYIISIPNWYNKNTTRSQEFRIMRECSFVFLYIQYMINLQLKKSWKFIIFFFSLYHII